jgi:hypothetical protein
MQKPTGSVAPNKKEKTCGQSNMKSKRTQKSEVPGTQLGLFDLFYPVFIN